MKNKYLLILALFTLLFTACKPRGETKTLTEILELATKNFNSSLESKELAYAKDKLTETGKLISAFLQNGESEKVREIANQIANNFSNLIEIAGYTSRPALTELAEQFRVLSTNPEAPMIGTVKLLAARAYNTLASEINSVGFKLGEREGR